jgi:hypothetical protein
VYYRDGMTLGQMRAELARYLGLDSTTSDGLIAFWDTQLINDALRMVEVELNVPRLWVLVDKETLESNSEVTLANGDSVLQVVAPPDQILPLISEEDWAPSDIYRPLVARYGYGAVVRYNPLRVLLIKPDSHEWPENVRIVYRPEHTPLVNETDEPWGGAYSRYHSLIPLRAARQALANLDPSEADTKLRLQNVMAEYATLKERFAEELDSGVTLTNNPFGVSVYYRRTRWT